MVGVCILLLHCMDMYVSLWLPGGVLWLPKQSPVHVVTCVVRDLPTTSGDWGISFNLSSMYWMSQLWSVQNAWCVMPKWAMPKWIYFTWFWSSARSRVDTAAASCSRAGQSKLQDPIPWGKSIAVHDWTCTVCVHCRIRWWTLWLKGLASSGFPGSIMKWKNF